MSLPHAPQDISEHPVAGSVTAPVDPKAQAADIDRKFQLYGVIQAFRQGCIPTNAQIDRALSYLHDAELIRVDQLSPGGQKLVQDSRDIIETARKIVKRKNADELFQNFVWRTRDVDAQSIKEAPGDISKADRVKLSEDSRIALRHLRTLLSLILTNSEIRKLLSDFSVIGRDLLAKGVSMAAEAIRPGQDEIAHVNEPAPVGEFVTAGGQAVGAEETPVLDVNIPRADIHVEQHPHDDKPTMKTSQGETKGGEILEQGKKAVQSTQEIETAGGEQAMEQQKNQSLKESDESQSATAESSAEEVEGKKSDLKERIKEKFKEHVPEGFSKRTTEHIEKGRHIFADEYFPAERREQFIYRGKKVIVECQQHSDYQDAIKWLLSVADEYVELGQTTGEKEEERDPPLRQAVSELRQLLERFANGESMHLIFDSIAALNDDARRDEEFKAWFRCLSTFIRKLLLEAGYVLGDECNHEARDIRESGKKFWDVKYRSHFDNVFKSTSDWFSAMGQDPLNKQFGEDWARLTRDLLFDSEGSLKFKPELWSDIRRVIVPTLVDKVGYIPIPRIEYSDDTLDLVLENLTLQGRNLFPNIVTLEAHNYMTFSPYDSIGDEHRHEFTFTFDQMQADMRDVAFFFRKKTGFPKVTDSGMADVVIGGSGVTSIVHLVSAGKDQSSVFKVKDVHVKVGSLKFSIRDTKHDLLYRTLKPLATGLVKRQIKRAIAGAIRTGMEYVDGQLVSVRDRMEEAKSSDETDRTHMLQEMFKRHKEEHGVRASESKSQFKVISSMRSSVIDTGHPSGWASRVSESEEKVATGEDWRSDAFSIV